MIAQSATIVAAWVPCRELVVDQVEHGIGLDFETVRSFMNLLALHPTETTDPIVVARRADGRLWITNGRHRWLAHLFLQIDAIAAVIVDEVPA
ncbi:MAG: ParB N-terminal domain-containing protein [Kouleothrix sp.]|nr:ParB N-terminal domain-containing protein [Kouleothrix sp.]